MPDPHAATSPAPVRRLSKQQQVLELRIMGATYRQIGKQLGISKSRVAELVRQGVDELNEQSRESADQLRAIEHQRLEALWRTLYPARIASDGTPDPDVIIKLVRVSESIRRLWGLDAPEEHHLHLQLQGEIEQLHVLPDTLLDDLATALGVTPQLPPADVELGEHDVVELADGQA